MRSRSVVGMLLTLLGVLALAAPGEATRRKYSVETSVPDGHAVCTFTGSVEHAKGRQLRLRVKTETGEALARLLPFSLDDAALEVGAGVQAGCDIFDPDGASDVDSASISTNGFLPFLGVVELHAHPGSNCAASTTAKGEVAVSIVKPGFDDVLKLSALSCSSDDDEANVLPIVDHPRRFRRGTRQRIRVLLRNLGPGLAMDSGFRVRIAAGLLLDVGTYLASRGHCRLEPVGNIAFAAPPECAAGAPACLEPLAAPLIATDFICDLGDMSAQDEAAVEFDLIAATTGLLTTTYRGRADNAGDLVPPILAGSQVQQGNTAILNVKVKTKNGADGTVNIAPPNRNCRAPDPQNPAAANAQCIEIYGAQTTVTLTATANQGQFDGWGDDCAGSGVNPVCTLVLDPGAAQPDKTAKAKFK